MRDLEEQAKVRTKGPVLHGPGSRDKLGPLCVCPRDATALGNGLPGWPAGHIRGCLLGLVGIQVGFPGEACFELEPGRGAGFSKLVNYMHSQVMLSIKHLGSMEKLTKCQSLP